MATFSCYSFNNNYEGVVDTPYLCGAVCNGSATLWAGAIEDEGSRLLVPGMLVCSGKLCNKYLCFTDYTEAIAIGVVTAILLLVSIVTMAFKGKKLVRMFKKQIGAEDAEAPVAIATVEATPAEVATTAVEATAVEAAPVTPAEAPSYFEADDLCHLGEVHDNISFYSLKDVQIQN